MIPSGRMVQFFRTSLLVTMALLSFPVLSGGQAHAQVAISEGECGFSPFISRASAYRQLVSQNDPSIGDFDAPVTVVEYFDPNCSHCKALHPIMKRVIERYRDHARFFMIPFVLWPHSLPQIEALYIAAARGKYHEMLDAQFSAQKPGGLSVQEISDIADETGLDPEWMKTRLAEGRHQTEIINRRNQIRGLGVTGTPTIMINGRFITDSSSKTAACIGQLIERALETGE